MATGEHLRSAAEREARGMFRTGRVSSVDSSLHTVRVAFKEDGDDVQTFDLPVLVTRPGDYSLPEVDSVVLCAIEPGSAGIGYVLGCLYTQADEPPIDDKAARVVASDDLRLGSHDAEDPVALAPKVKEELQALKNHFTAIESILTGPPINEPGMGAPSALQLALKEAISASEYPTPGDVGAEKVKAI